MEVKKVLSVLFKKDKAVTIVVVIGVIGIALIYLSTFFTSGEKKEAPKPAEEVTVSASDYEKQLEDRLAGVVAAITGETQPEIMVTLSSQSRFVYATDEKNSTRDNDQYAEGGITATENSNDNETSYIILKDADGAQYALKITEIEPEIKGVVVVSAYADNVLYREKITNAVKTALGISSAKVCVVGTN